MVYGNRYDNLRNSDAKTTKAVYLNLNNMDHIIAVVYCICDTDFVFTAVFRCHARGN